MVDVIVDQRFLRFADRLFDRMELLGQIETRPVFAEHLDNTVKVTFGPLQSLDDLRMAGVRMFFHQNKPIPLEGIRQSRRGLAARLGSQVNGVFGRILHLTRKRDSVAEGVIRRGCSHGHDDDRIFRRGPPPPGIGWRCF